jgi:hypothetical protein
MTIVAGDNDPLTNAKSGFPAYPALWARWETEVRSAQPNRFADLILIDELWDGDGNAKETLKGKWRQVSDEWWNASAPTENGEFSLGLEWGRPRRVLVELWQQVEEGDGR